MAARGGTGSSGAFPGGRGPGAMARRFANRFRFSTAGHRVFAMVRLSSSRGWQDQRGEDKKQQKDAFGHNRLLWGKNIIA
jgi:hypothetical protein